MTDTTSPRVAQARHTIHPPRWLAEQAVIAGLIRSPDCYETIAQTVGAEHFSVELHRQIFEEIRAIHATGAPFNLLHLRCRLPEETPDGVPVAAHLAALLGNHEDSGPASDYVEYIAAAPDIAPDGDGVGTYGGDEGKRKPAITLTYFEGCSEPAPKLWLIKNVVARGEISSWIAPPGMGKSALLGDIGVHVATGSDWRGYRSKGAGGVVYLALERGDLVKRRLVAHARHAGLSSLPVAVSSQVIDLLNPACVADIVGAVREAEIHFGLPVGLVVIDTYPKGIAAGGGDEDKAKDQGKVLANLRRVLELVPVHVAMVGHTGKDESRGARGSNAHLADADVMVQISGGAIKTANVIKANDQPEGHLTTFRLEAVALGIDDDGDEFSTSIVSADTYNSAADSPKKAPHLTNATRNALRALQEALADVGTAAAPSSHIPAGVTVVTVEQWRKEAYRRGISDGEDRARQLAFKRACDALIATGLIGLFDGLVWVSNS
jgi:AAA domain-containing protein/DnaB helicase-like protein